MIARVSIPRGLQRRHRQIISERSTVTVVLKQTDEPLFGLSGDGER